MYSPRPLFLYVFDPQGCAHVGMTLCGSRIPESAFHRNSNFSSTIKVLRILCYIIIVNIRYVT